MSDLNLDIVKLTKTGKFGIFGKLSKYNIPLRHLL